MMLKTWSSRPTVGGVADRLRSPRSNRRGAAVIEFALIAPVFFAIVFGMIEMGRAVMVTQVAGAAAREGVRKAAITSMTAEEVKTWVRDYLNGCGVFDSACTIELSQRVPGSDGFEGTEDLSETPYASSLRMTITVDFAQVTWIPDNAAFAVMPGNAQIMQIAEARKETE